MPRTRAADVLELRIESRGGAGGRRARNLGVVARIINSSASRGDLEAGYDAVLVRRASGHEVLRGPVEGSLRRYLRRAVDADLGAMSESEFLAAWGGAGSWTQRYDRWRERGWVPPVR